MVATVEMNARKHIREHREESDTKFAETNTAKDTRRTKKQWESYRSILQKLYVDEGNTLGVVMKIMEEKYGFKATVKQYRHQLGEKWGWRKYNQGGMKLPPARARKSRPPNNSSDSQEDEIIVASGAPEVLGRDIGSLRASLSALLTDQRQDEKTMRALKRANPDDIARCIRLCFRWCEKEIDVDEAQLPFPYGGAMDAEADDTHTPDSKYECDARIFVYLLDRYISSATSPDRDGDWDALTRALVGLCPLKALFTMSTLIMTVVGNTLDACRDETSLAAPAAAAAAAGLGDEFDVARLGLREIGRRGWGDEKLAAEFCDEFEAILDDYAAYGDAVVAAVRDYVAHTWPEGREAGAGGFADVEDLFPGALFPDAPFLGVELTDAPDWWAS